MAQCIVIAPVCVFVCGSVTTITRNCVHRSSPKCQSFSNDELEMTETTLTKFGRPFTVACPIRLNPLANVKVTKLGNPRWHQSSAQGDDDAVCTWCHEYSWWRTWSLGGVLSRRIQSAVENTQQHDNFRLCALHHSEGSNVPRVRCSV